MLSTLPTDQCYSKVSIIAAHCTFAELCSQRPRKSFSTPLPQLQLDLSTSARLREHVLYFLLTQTLLLPTQAGWTSRKLQPETSNQVLALLTESVCSNLYYVFSNDHSVHLAFQMNHECPTVVLPSQNQLLAVQCILVKMCRINYLPWCQLTSRIDSCMAEAQQHDLRSLVKGHQSTPDPCLCN